MGKPRRYSRERVLKSSKMKICIISNLYSPYIIGGAEINAERLAKALSKHNKVFVITTRPFDNLFSLFSIKGRVDGISVYRFYPLNLYNVYFTKKRKIPSWIKVIWHIVDLFNIHSFFVVLRILKKEKPDIVHTNNLDGISFSIFWGIKLLSIPLVHTLHDYHLLCPYANLICPCTKFKICKKRPFPCRVYSFFKRLVVDSIPKVVIGPSQFIVDMHIKYGFFKKSCFKRVPYFIETKESSFVFYKENKDTFNLLYVGRLSKEKGVDVLIRSFMSLEGSFLRLHIIGDGPEKRKLEMLGKDDKRIIFYGRVNQPELDKFYKLGDVLVVPSIWDEVFGRVIIEAFSFGVVVVGSNRGGIKELIQHRYNGFLFDVEKRDDLVHLLKYCNQLKRKGELRLLQENAFHSASEFDEDKIIEKWMRVYRDV